jgi:hypothetical protein
VSHDAPAAVWAQQRQTLHCSRAYTPFPHSTPSSIDVTTLLYSTAYCTLAVQGLAGVIWRHSAPSTPPPPLTLFCCQRGGHHAERCSPLSHLLTSPQLSLGWCLLSPPPLVRPEPSENGSGEGCSVGDGGREKALDRIASRPRPRPAPRRHLPQRPDGEQRAGHSEQRPQHTRRTRRPLPCLRVGGEYGRL